MVANPYANDAQPASNPTPPAAMGPDVRYAVPDPRNSNPPYADEQGWAPHLRTESNGTPDAERLGLAPIRQRREYADRPDAWYDEYTDYDDARRHAVEQQDGNGFDTRRTHELRRAPDPRWNPPAPSRWTGSQSPRSYAFLRPFQRPPARNNGMHFSMADHRRTYDVLGMAPVQSRRNTYRADPAPWDANVVDMPVNVSPVNARVQVISLPPRTGGSFRLGG